MHYAFGLDFSIDLIMPNNIHDTNRYDTAKSTHRRMKEWNARELRTASLYRSHTTLFPARTVACSGHGSGNCTTSLRPTSSDSDGSHDTSTT